MHKIVLIIYNYLVFFFGILLLIRLYTEQNCEFLNLGILLTPIVFYLYFIFNRLNLEHKVSNLPLFVIYDICFIVFFIAYIIFLDSILNPIESIWIGT